MPSLEGALRCIEAVFENEKQYFGQRSHIAARCRLLFLHGESPDR
ncbi:hypothetical protein BRPE64_ACDS11460 [Caballeronia insecticola]|uniref:Uncharacterized protein n=1 Tax=Caballeronia insecticola TaxID=758793 RepID=R4WPU5_9BURK|nr:hypothetical protein BRPE64_ACDS11460 [Caballeronia insecticola]